MTPAARCAVHREVAALGACPRCGNFACAQCTGGRSNGMCAACNAIAAEAERQPTAWERRAELGPLKALWVTWKESMFAPDPFFRKLQPDGPASDAVLYAFLMMVLMVVPSFMQQALSAEQTLQTFRAAFRGASWLDGVAWWHYAAAMSVGGVVLFPVFFFFGAAFWHVCALMVGASAGGWSGSLRVMGYSYGCMAAYVVPYVGPLLTLYWLPLLVIGVMRVHKVSVLRALMATVVVPLAVLTILSCGGAFAIIAMLRP